MASAFPSRGMGNPAACLTVRDLGDIQFGCLGPGGEIRGGVAVAVHDQPATIAAEGPCPQRHLLRDPATPRTGLGRGKPALAYHQVAPEPGRLVSKLTSELRPSGIGDGSSEALVADQVGHRKVFKGQPAVGLGELAGDLMKEASTDPGNTMVLSGEQAGRFCPVSGSPLSACDPAGAPP